MISRPFNNCSESQTWQIIVILRTVNRCRSAMIHYCLGYRQLVVELSDAEPCSVNNHRAPALASGRAISVPQIYQNSYTNCARILNENKISVCIALDNWLGAKHIVFEVESLLHSVLF